MSRVFDDILNFVEKNKLKLRPIARKRHNYLYLLISILFGILTAYIFFNYPPEGNIKLQNVLLPVIPVFFITLSIFIYSLATFLFFRPIQGVLFVIFILGYVAMRLIGLTHWIFLILLFALFLTIELLILKKK